MRIALGGHHICVTQKFLHCTQVGSVVEQMSGESVSQCVWMSGVNGPSIEYSPHVARGEFFTALIEEECI
jgi:hypothetical protein